MATKANVLTYAGYLAMLPVEGRYEIIDGDLISMTPGPTEPHQRIARALFRILDGFVTRHNLGEVYFAPLDILISTDPLRTRQPDLLFIHRDRLSIIHDQIEGGPDLVIEILSPGNSRNQLADKFVDYARRSVQECWIVSPEAQTVEVLALAEERMQRVRLYGIGDDLHSPVLPGLSVSVSEIFP